MSRLELPARDDFSAWRSLIASLEDQVFRLFGDRDLAEEGVQVALMEFFAGKGMDSQGEPLGQGWLKFLCMKRASDLRRARNKRSKHREQEIALLAETDLMRNVPPVRRLEVAELWFLVADIFETLEPEEIREMMRLITIDGLSFAEAVGRRPMTAKGSPMTEVNARQLVWVGRHKLRDLLKKADGLLDMLSEFRP